MVFFLIVLEDGDSYKGRREIFGVLIKIGFDCILKNLIILI